MGNSTAPGAWCESFAAWRHIVFDGWLAAIGLIGAVVLGVVIAVPIAWFNLGGHLANALQSESRSGTINRATQRLRHGFIVVRSPSLCVARRLIRTESSTGT